jgi:tRNA threonylcarbamoyl adenosine modification protein (Sua5/YciO/YrdC/YwlC family)
MSQLSELRLSGQPVFKLLKEPARTVYIHCPANNQIPKLFKNKKKTVGIRIPDNSIVLELIRELGRPMMTSSIHDQDQVVEYITDPELIYEKYRDFAEIVIDGGYGKNEASTIVDCTSEEIRVVRQGLGVLEF